MSPTPGSEGRTRPPGRSSTLERRPVGARASDEPSCSTAQSAPMQDHMHTDAPEHPDTRGGGSHPVISTQPTHSTSYAHRRRTSDRPLTDWRVRSPRAHGSSCSSSRRTKVENRPRLSVACPISSIKSTDALRIRRTARPGRLANSKAALGRNYLVGDIGYIHYSQSPALKKHAIK